MKIRKIEVLSGNSSFQIGKEGNPIRDYSDGSITIYRGMSSQIYRFPFGQPYLLEMKIHSEYYPDDQFGILLLSVPALTNEVDIPKGIVCKSSSSLDDFLEKAQVSPSPPGLDILGYSAHIDSLLTELGKTFREVDELKNPFDNPQEDMQKLARRDILTGMKHRFKGLIDLIGETNFDIVYGQSPVPNFIRRGYNELGEQLYDTLTIAGEQLYDIEVEIRSLGGV